MSRVPCRVPSCRELRGEERIVCFDCWSLVPVALQRTLVFLWRNGDPWPGFEDALANATDQVERSRGIREMKARRRN